MTITHALVSGATGFIGRHLMAALARSGVNVVALVRPRPNRSRARLTVAAIIGDLENPVSLDGTCTDIDTVFHLAGYAHAEDANDDAAEAIHQRVTVEGTRALLREAVRAGVKRFVYASTVKAMGDATDCCLDETSSTQPNSAYGRAKRAAEELVLEAGRRHGMHACVLRFPLVYGRDNKGNLPRLISAIDRNRFPPLTEIDNRRSMVHVDDAVQALRLVTERSEARGRVYIVTDGQAYSTTDIYRRIRAALGKPAPRWFVPWWLLHAGAYVGDAIGRVRGRRFVLNSLVVGKLMESAWYSNDKIRHELGFRPERTLADGLPEMIEEYRKQKK